MKIVNEKWMSAEDIKNIPKCDTPLLVISDAVQSSIAARIKSLQKGTYNHFMYLINVNGKNIFASQDATYRLVPLSNYVTNKHRLKFWSNPDWTDEEKAVILGSIQSHLELPWYKRSYDILQIFGIRFGIRWLQLPGARICSDYVNLLGLINNNYNLKEHPSPPEVNRWLKTQSKYKVYGRYTPD